MTPAYIRVSTDRQLEFSPESQKMDITRYCELYRLDPPIFFVDEGISGRFQRKRTEFHKFIQAALKSKNCVVYAMSRFGRNTLENLQSLDMLDKKGIAFHSVKEKIDSSTAMGKFFITNLCAIAQLESDQTSERVRDNFSNKKRIGMRYSRPLFGFQTQVVKTTDQEYSSLIVDRAGKLKPDDHEKRVVEEIFRLRKYMSLHKIASHLNDIGVTGKNGGKFGSNTIKKILEKEEFYKTMDFSV